MAILTTKDLITDSLSASGIKLLNSITANRIWGETTLQFGYGTDSVLELDPEFAAEFQSMFGNATPDAEFAFASLAERAFGMIDTVSNLDFAWTSSASEVDLVLTSTDDKPNSGLEGFFEFPGTSFRDDGADSWSIGAFNSALGALLTAPELGGGEYANWTILHEIGHSLGLKHTHQEVNGLPPLSTIGKFMNNERYSVMSYQGASQGMEYGHAVSMMALDVAALQSLYGKEDYAVGTSTYSLMDAMGGSLSLAEGNVDIGRAYYCIWDSAGEDTIDYAGSGNSVMINLNDATLDTSGIAGHLKAMMTQLKATNFFTYMSSGLKQDILDQWHHAGGFFSQVLNDSGKTFKGIAGGFSIAHDAIIENAVGGDSADLLIGNEQANSLTGLDGHDTLLGSAGGDLLFGNAGSDWLDGGTGSDLLTGGSDRDRFVFSNKYGADTITDFEFGDVIDLRKLTAIDSFAELSRKYMQEIDGDVVITVGNDTLVISDWNEGDLSKANFYI